MATAILAILASLLGLGAWWWKRRRSPSQQEPLRHMTPDSFVREGGTRYWKTRDEYIAMMGGGDRAPWVLRFEHLPNTKLSH